MSFIKAVLFTILAAITSYASAFQEVGGTLCTGVGPCSYSYLNANGDSVNVNGWCAPNGFCADNGAQCTSDASCYNYCGSNSICGGTGASCNTQALFFHNQFDAACHTPAYTCSTNGPGGTCRPGASLSVKLKQRALIARALDRTRAARGEIIIATRQQHAGEEAEQVM